MVVHSRPVPSDDRSCDPEVLDVVVIGAGLSGVCVGVYLKKERPNDTFAILESRDAIGGTWDLFRYPGVRSDSDMPTLGYTFKEWDSETMFADGPSIRSYVREAAREHGLMPHVRFGHRVTGAAWSSSDELWTLHVETADGPATIRCRFIIASTGYYDYQQGYVPQLEGTADFGGEILHPQFWPEGRSFDGKHVTIIGSGATAVTMAPALAAMGAKVTMVQRTPTFIFDAPSHDRIARLLRSVLPKKAAHRMVRWKNLLFSMYLYRHARNKPEKVRRLVLENARKKMGDRVDVARHFNPPYDPWDQRFCLAPDGDFFKAVKSGALDIVTGNIDRFVPEGIRMASGETIATDIAVTATGLKIKLLGGIDLNVDGRPYDMSAAVSYKGTMFSGLPNMAFVFGYTNASWTLKCELIARWIPRLLDHMERTGTPVVTPTPPAGIATRPFVDLKSGYIARAQAIMPRQGTSGPWVVHQNYLADRKAFDGKSIDDGALVFSKARS